MPARRVDAARRVRDQVARPELLQDLFERLRQVVGRVGLDEASARRRGDGFEEVGLTRKVLGTLADRRAPAAHLVRPA